MSRRMRVIFSGLTALPLALVGLSLAAGSASATTGGCFLPEIAASVFGSDDFGGSFFDEVELSDDPGRRKHQCQDFLKGCKLVVKQSGQCLEAAVDALKDGELEACKDSGDPSGCKSDVTMDYDGFKGFISDNVSNGRDICRECYEDCLEGITGQCSGFDE